MVELLHAYTKQLRLQIKLRSLREWLASSPGVTSPAADVSIPAPRYPHKIVQRLDPAVIEQLVGEYVAGETSVTLMTRYSLGKGTVLELLRTAGVEVRRSPGLTDDDLPEAVRLYGEGWSCQRLGERFGCDASTVHRALRAAGVMLRKPWERA